MPSANASLQRAVYDALRSNAVVVDLLGGLRIHDDVPPQTAFPCITFGQSQERDWSTGSESGAEHILTLHVWSRGKGRRLVQEIVGALRDALVDQDLGLEGHRLVNLRQEFAETRTDPDGETWHGIIRFRAVTEPQ